MIELVAEDSQRGQRDLILNPSQYAFILDGNKGTIEVYVGPKMTSMGPNDKIVVYDRQSKQFKNAINETGVQPFVVADEGSYVVLTNPNNPAGKEHPAPATSSALPELDYGRKIVIAGPTRFPLWPGQEAEVVEGHQLKSNQFLLARVYNEGAAQTNWGEAVIKAQSAVPEAAPCESHSEGESSDQEEKPELPVVEPNDANEPSLSELSAEDLRLGQIIVIKGSEVSFYIPPTGIEIVKDERGRFIRDAVTLERLEYCLLLDESGEKRYVRGPAVVFPRPTEQFVKTDDGSKKFRALELNDDMGIYIKVIADYVEGDREYHVGDELFITGKEQRIYFPREEHSIIRYGDHSVHYAVAIPAGEGRYALNKTVGSVDLVKGPKMFLADPRTQVNVRRALDEKTVALYYPGNSEALEYNRRICGMIGERTERYLSEDEYADGAPSYLASYGASAASFGHTPKDEFERSTTYTPPRTITLNDSKYLGAVGINVWTGYAVNVVSKSNQRRVVVGPASILLGYDEWMEALELSTGRPKNRDKTLRTVYLRVKNNTVSDRVDVVTKDLVEVVVTVSYRVNFEGEPNKWFDVEDYVGFLTEHLRSMIANEVKNHGIEEFMAHSADIIRDTVLGKSQEGERTGRVFAENGMRVYDVEILEVKIGDREIERMLTSAQNDTVEQALELAADRRRVEAAVTQQNLTRQELQAQADTESLKTELQVAKTEREAAANEVAERAKRALQDIINAAKAADQLARIEREAKDAAVEAARDHQELEAQTARDEQKLSVQSREAQIEIEKVAAIVEAEIERVKAVSPQLAEAITLMGNQVFAAELAKAIGPLSAVHGEGIDETFLKIFSRIPALSPVLAGLGVETVKHAFSTPAEPVSEPSGDED